MFPYESTANKFNIPHDLNILKEVFNIEDGKYMKENSYWKSYNINTLINELKSNDKNKLTCHNDCIYVFSSVLHKITFQTKMLVMKATFVFLSPACIL